MYVLESFWSAAARLSGRLDLSSLVSVGLDPATADDETLRHHGVSGQHLRRLREGIALETVALPVRITDARYPDLLRPLPHAPPVLFLLGALDLLLAPAVAIVGARRCSLLAERFARQLSGATAAGGGVVVSGLAWGVDAAAHEAAGGRTIAVVGQSLDVPFAGSLRRRVGALVEAGCLLVSEFPPRQRPDRWTFRQRNRVISGLSQATVVVEAGERSGSLITARCALDQGRELFVVPDHPAHPHSAGGLSLLEAGIPPLTSPAPLLELLQLGPHKPRSPEGLLAMLSDLPDVTTLARRLDQPLRQVRQELSALELDGRVVRLPGGRYGPAAQAPRRSP